MRADVTIDGMRIHLLSVTSGISGVVRRYRDFVKGAVMHHGNQYCMGGGDQKKGTDGEGLWLRYLSLSFIYLDKYALLFINIECLLYYIIVCVQ